MRQRVFQHAHHGVSTALSFLLAVIVLGSGDRICRAADNCDPPPPLPPRPEIRSGGVIEESYIYHRQPGVRVAARSVEPAGGWYGYGFPVSTFRWGSFGANHYYPTVFWHDKFYGDCSRIAYRRGY